ncbi:MAG: hypothetical protein Q4E13_11685, partial [Clostridia bacterium]|nr:hypothetical protein [Clostridia bacterium]
MSNVIFVSHGAVDVRGRVFQFPEKQFRRFVSRIICALNLRLGAAEAAGFPPDRNERVPEVGEAGDNITMPCLTNGRKSIILNNWRPMPIIIQPGQG